MTRFDARRAEWLLRRHGWTAYAYYSEGAWQVVCNWPGDSREEKWASGIEGAWFTVRNLRQAFYAIRWHSARAWKGETA